MADGDNAELIAAQQKVAELEAEKTKLEAEKVKLEGMHDADQTQIAKTGSELGDIRKENKAILEKIDALEKSKTTVPPDTGTPPKKETVEDLEKSLDSEQQKILEGVYAGLSPDDKLKYHDDEKFRKVFLDQAKQHAREVPDSPWKKPAESTNNGGDDLNKSIAAMFENQKQRNGYVPSGPAPSRNSATGRGGSATQPMNTSPEVKTLKGSGIIGRGAA